MADLIYGATAEKTSKDWGAVYTAAGSPAARNTISLDNHRRTFSIANELVQAFPNEAPFFTMLAKIAKKKTTDPIFKMMEERQQWQRRNFVLNAALSGAKVSDTDVQFSCDYDKFGKLDSSNNNYSAFFLLNNQIIAIENVTSDNDSVTGTLYARVGYNSSNMTVTHNAGSGTEGTNAYTTVRLYAMHILESDGTITNISTPATDTFTAAAGSRAQVVGTAFPEGSSYPGGWTDDISMAEGYCQIFKTAIPMFSGTSMATEYRGRKNEFARAWYNAMKVHKMDLEHASLFGIGKGSVTTSTGLERTTWGILPFVMKFGTILPMSYAASGYNDFVDFAMEFFTPENGNSDGKVIMASRKIISWFAKIGQGLSFVGNSLGGSTGRFDVWKRKSRFGFMITGIDTPFGTFNFVENALLRNQWEDYAILVDMEHVHWRPLAGNGMSRDTFIKTNVQDNGVDGRVDMMLTEAGLQITIPERHVVMKFS